MNSDFTVKRDLIRAGRRLWRQGFVPATDGNLSVKVADGIIITPSGVNKGLLRQDQIIKVDPDGRVIEGDYRPSSEMPMHLEVYKARPEITAVVHAHPPYAVTFAVAGEPLNQKILAEMIVLAGDIPLVPFGLPSTDEVPEKLRPYLKNHKFFLLEFHGALTIGSSLEEAVQNMERLEYFARIIWNLRTIGSERRLTKEQVDRLTELRQKFNG